jgi:lysophospholipase L1-like esterase
VYKEKFMVPRRVGCTDWLSNPGGLRMLIRDFAAEAAPNICGRDEISTLRIAGFGACMITGYPHEGGGLFDVACGVVKERLARPVQSNVVSLGGFPAPRAEKYLSKKLFAFDPDYIVIQFGATDAQCPIRATSRPDRRPSGDNSETSTTRLTASYHARPATALSHLRWQLASSIGQIRRIEPITPLPSFVTAIEHMIDECRSAHVRPVILSPFAYGSRYTSKRAVAYVDALRGLHARASDMVFVDCFSLLAKFPKIRILQHDGFHLSRLGHSLVGEAVGQAIVRDFSKQSAERRHSAK